MTKLLAVDDNPDNLISISALLTSVIPDCRVITAGSGPEGIEKALSESPDTILLDVKMPIMDGYAVCERLKQNRKTRHIPVLMISAVKKTAEDYIRGLESGADGYLPKPIDPHVLAAQVNSALRVKNAEDKLRNQKTLLNRMLRRKTIELIEKNRLLTQQIAEREKAEAALKKNEGKYRTMMEAMDDLVFICSRDFIMEYQNPAMTRRIERDATGDLCFKVMHGFDKPCPWCTHGRVMAGEAIKTEVLSPKDQKQYLVSNLPIHHADGSISKMSIMRDITDIKKMSDRLDQAQRMEAIGTLAGGIAHDFNNILFPIVGMAEMLLDDLPAQNPEHEKVKAIHTAALRAGDLVKQILSFSRQTGQEKIPVLMQSILTEVLKLIRSSIPSNIKITQSIPKNCGPVLANPGQIHQIIMNLVTNAYHAVEKTEGSISVVLNESTLTGSEWMDISLNPGKYAVLTVADTGHGIDPGIKDKIFDPYFTTKAEGKGTGLGLSVVHGIVKDHGGDIHLMSKVGEGTLFSVYLPILQKAMEAVPTGIPEPLETGTEHILLVDDEAAIIRLEQMILEKLGYQTTACGGSADALSLFRKNPMAFDLVITDLTMPEMTGDRLAGELISIRPDIPVILCTGFSEKIDTLNPASLGIKGILMKPVVRSEIAALIRKALGDKTS